MFSEVPHPSLDKGSQEFTEEYIRLRAFELFEARGCDHGYALQDWLQAEAEILGARKPADSAGRKKMSRRAGAR
jgi:hypothetical protein